MMKKLTPPSNELSKALNTLMNLPPTPRDKVVMPTRILAVGPHRGKASEFAQKSHAGQERKYTGEPYFHHLANVVMILERHGDWDDAVISAAWLHDTIEDTACNLADIRKEFGDAIAELVYWLTDYPIPGNRETRTLAAAWRLSRAPAGVVAIKLADTIDNTGSIVAHDPDFSKVYLGEKLRLLRLIKENSPWVVHSPLYWEAVDLVEKNIGMFNNHSVS